MICFHVFVLFFLVKLVKSNEPLDCSLYQSDKDVVESLGFFLLINPLTITNSSYAIVNEHGSVVELHIYEERSISNLIFCFEKLRTLSIVNSKFCVSDDLIRLSSNLEHLQLYNIYPSLKSLPPEIFSLTSLKILQIIRCDIETIPDEISLLKQLQILNLQRNRLAQSLPGTLITLEHLISIDISYNQWFDSLESLNGSTSIRELKASHCSITELPNHLSHLSILDLSHNLLSSLKGIETLNSAHSAEKKDSKIHSSSHELDSESILSDLDFSHNKLSRLPEEMFKLAFLKKINLKHNDFDAQEIEWILGRFRRVKSLPIVMI